MLLNYNTTVKHIHIYEYVALKQIIKYERNKYILTMKR